MAHIARRIGQAVLVLFITFTVAFLLLSALPSDGVMARFGDPALGLSQAEIDGIREEMGIDKPPLLTQYLTSLAGFVTGNFGISTQTGTAVSSMVATALPHTLALAASSIALAIVVALAFAFLATTVPPAVGGFFRALPSFMVSLPGFWIAILLLQFFSFKLGWVRVIDPSPPFEGLILPTLTLAVPMAAPPLTQVLIRSIDGTRAMTFVQVVRARGASESWVFWRNILRNSLLPPALTMVGLLFGELVGGAVVTETVFGRPPGLGYLTVQAVSNRDTPPVLLAIVIIAATAYVLINLIVDLLYPPVLDVRLRERPLSDAPPSTSAQLERTA